MKGLAPSGANQERLNQKRLNQKRQYSAFLEKRSAPVDGRKRDAVPDL